MTVRYHKQPALIRRVSALWISIQPAQSDTLCTYAVGGEAGCGVGAAVGWNQNEMLWVQSTSPLHHRPHTHSTGSHCRAHWLKPSVCFDGSDVPPRDTSEPTLRPACSQGTIKHPVRTKIYALCRSGRRVMVSHYPSLSPAPPSLITPRGIRTPRTF